MGDRKSGSSSKKSKRSSKESAERSQKPEKSQGDQATSNATTRNFSEYYTSSSGAVEKSGTGKSQSLQQESTRDDGYDDGDYVDNEEDRKAAMKKRFSSHSHTNVYTECGRHSDQWLVGPIIDGAKALFGSSSKKK